MNLERDTSIGKLQLTRHNEQNMGIKDLIMSMLGSKKEEHTGPVGSDEAVENYSQFVEAKEELSKSILNELSSEDEQPDHPPETIILSEYDVGEVEVKGGQGRMAQFTRDFARGKLLSIALNRVLNVAAFASLLTKCA